MEHKQLLVDLTKPEKKPRKEKVVETVRIPKKRVITSTDKWTQEIISLSPELQLECISQIIEKTIPDQNKGPCELILQQIAQKIGGYKSQDLQKELYAEDDFVTIEKVLDLMKTSENRCFYCKKLVQILYENVREPMQWTLERIDNDYGHNSNNVEIACLNCNLHRRTMYHERYLFTKELTIVKQV
jgi:hypothetical protein